MCYDVIMAGKTTSAADAVMLFDVVRWYACYDEAKRAELWARNAEGKVREGTFKKDNPNDYISLIGVDGKQIKIIAFPSK